MMKKIIILILFLTLTLIGAFLFYHDAQNRKEIILPPINQPIENNNIAEQTTKQIEQKNVSDFQAPLDRASERVTKKPFGILIDPKTSPVQPEKFAGYHTGVDFEIFPEELDVDVTVHSVCSGKVSSVGYINGYGGVVIQECLLDEKNITVLYGHLKLASVDLVSGNSLLKGETIGNLGKAFSAETGGERKHLHLGFHKGSEIKYLGYVRNKKDLSNWIDPCLYVCEK